MFIFGFPPTMMIVMLAMNTVERRLTGPGKPALQVVDGGAAGGPAPAGPAPALRLVTSAEHGEA
jgi:hypothetical protein